MKALKKLLCGLACVCLASGVLSACESSSETATYFIDRGDGNKTTVSVEYRGEQIETLSARMELDLLTTDILASNIQEFYDELFEPIKDKAFANVSYGSDGDLFLLEFSFTELDVAENADAFAALELFPEFSVDTTVSQLKEALTEEGYTEVTE